MSSRVMEVPPVDTVEIDTLIKDSVRVGNRIAELEAAHEAKVKPFTDKLNEIKGLLQQFLEESGQKSARTAEGLVTIVVQSNARLTDPDAFIDYIRKTGEFELMDRKANSTACRDYVEANGYLPPGVDLSNRRSVRITPTNKEKSL